MPDRKQQRKQAELIVNALGNAFLPGVGQALMKGPADRQRGVEQRRREKEAEALRLRLSGLGRGRER